MNRLRPMRGYYARRVVAAELGRAERVGRYADWEYLRSETGLSWTKLERLVRAARRSLGTNSAVVAIPIPTAAEGGAEVVPDGQSPTLWVRSRLLCAPYAWSFGR